MRRCALLEVGGFSDIIFFPGEEDLIALDVTAAGWDLVYAAEVRRRDYARYLEELDRLIQQELGGDDQRS